MKTCLYLQIRLLTEEITEVPNYTIKSNLGNIKFKNNNLRHFVETPMKAVDGQSLQLSPRLRSTSPNSSALILKHNNKRIKVLRTVILGFIFVRFESLNTLANYR